MPSIVVINGADAITPRTQEGLAAYTDLAGSDVSAPHPIVAGVWDLADLDEPTPVFEAEWDEMKYMIAGELTLRNGETGEISELRAGSMLWIPTGAKMSILKSKGVRVVYVEQQYRKGMFTSST
ncbi:hypothetical protein BP00DRAFT_347230 [Aspergillus indologenus CBS 114.80]|uniref:(S)-ureidoglycine aminohydrolase cupin domain-containing protein n=1 Tax=Aspergillus indologenus CBS 114.80 TaxID=1450541 RepID=A0A2V5I4R4_9EURO|nr:hypothetical protein BP00DRAFT_347230 [Aspergillus indologenus CBS 114.80]